MGQGKLKRDKKRIQKQVNKLSKEIVRGAVLQIQQTPLKSRLNWAWRILIKKDYRIFKKKGLVK